MSAVAQCHKQHTCKAATRQAIPLLLVLTDGGARPSELLTFAAAAAQLACARVRSESTVALSACHAAQGVA